jgi:hypothetical protein
MVQISGEKIMGEIGNIARSKHELEEGFSRLHRLIHFYELLDYSDTSFSQQLMELIAGSKTLTQRLEQILEKNDWNKLPELKKEMLHVLEAIEKYQIQLRNNQEEYELLLKVQRDYQNIMLSMNLLHQQQVEYQDILVENNKKALVDNPPTYSSLPRLEPKYQPISGSKDDTKE